MDNQMTKKYGLFTAMAMVVGIVIGSGVFFKSQDVLKKTNGNISLGVLAWIIGGVIMIVLAYTFANLATKYEKAGGFVDYAEMTVGKKYAYYAGWFLSTIYYPTLTSVLAWVSARYTVELINPAWSITGGECMSIACFYLVGAYSLNMLAPKLAGKVQVSATVIKIIPLLLMAVVGTITGLVNGTLIDNFTKTTLEVATKGNGFFGAIVATAFAYEGWIVATTINSEIKDSKKNLPRALVLGTILIMVIYIVYYIGVAGAVNKNDIMDYGTKAAFVKIFGKVGGVLLMVFVVISCLGTLNGLMLACARGMYNLSVRGYGVKPKVFAVVDKETNVCGNSGILGLLLCAMWLLYFYGANLGSGWFGVFNFDSSELPIITIYGFFIPVMIMMMVKEKDYNVFKRFITPSLSILGCVFMIICAIYAHGYVPYLNSDKFTMPVLFYLIIFIVDLLIGYLFNLKKKNPKNPVLQAETNGETQAEDTTQIQNENLAEDKK